MVSLKVRRLQLPAKLSNPTVGLQTHASSAQPHLLSAAELTVWAYTREQHELTDALNKTSPPDGPAAEEEVHPPGGDITIGRRRARRRRLPGLQRRKILSSLGEFKSV